MKKLYFFRPNLKNHFYLYYSWITAARKKGVDVTMFTVMSVKQKRTQIVEYNEIVKLDGTKIIITPHILLNTLYTISYLLFNIIKHSRVSLIAKKVNLKPLTLVKFFFSNRFKYIIEIEGDAASEHAYLKKHPYKAGFYNDYLLSSANSIDSFSIKAKKADRLLVLSENFKTVLLERHRFLNSAKIQVISTGFIKGRFFYDNKNREIYRKKLSIGNETVFIYAGNIYYSWQNIKKTLKFFYYYLENIDEHAKFIILTHKNDQYIAEQFISDIGIDSSKIIIKEVPNSEIINYYNAADVCVLLRDNDLMNHVASPGKIGEYAASGTPILTSSYIGDYANLFKGQRLVAQIDDISNFKEMAEKVSDLLTVSIEDKIAFSRWSNDKLSSENNVDSFINAFEM